MDGRHPDPQDASGDIRVSLDSSTPCWNDAIEGFYFRCPKNIQSRAFLGRSRRPRTQMSKFSNFVLPSALLRACFASFVVKCVFPYFIDCVLTQRLGRVDVELEAASLLSNHHAVVAPSGLERHIPGSHIGEHALRGTLQRIAESAAATHLGDEAFSLLKP